MSSFRQVSSRLIFAALAALSVVAASCGGNESGEIAASESFEIESNESNLALVACIQDKGVDARVVPGGGVNWGANSSLSKDELEEIGNSCLDELAARGIIPAAATGIKPYSAFLTELECVEEAGFPVPEIVSEETYNADPGTMVSPFELLVDTVEFDVFFRELAPCFPDDAFVIVD